MTPEDQRRIIVAKDDRRIPVLPEPSRFTLMAERRCIVIDDLGRIALQG